MWGRKRQNVAEMRPAEPPPPERLKEALRKARVDQAERTGVVVDLHDAVVARLEILNIHCKKRDITRSKRAQAELQASERRFRNLADSAPVLIWTTNEEGRIEFWTWSPRIV